LDDAVIKIGQKSGINVLPFVNVAVHSNELVLGHFLLHLYKSLYNRDFLRTGSDLYIKDNTLQEPLKQKTANNNTNNTTATTTTVVVVA
jgi:hypothetical protein